MDKGGKETSARLRIILSMTIFGTIGLVRRGIPYSSAMIACMRGLIATLILLAVHRIRIMRGRTAGFDRGNLRRNMGLLLVSGAMIGFNWILLFEAYRYTTISVATVCYYMAPVFTMMISPIYLKEKITVRTIICTIVALAGIILVSGVVGPGSDSPQDLSDTHLKGVLFGLGAALLYSLVVNINKKIEGVGGMDRTIFQMGPACIAVLPYWLLTENFSAMRADATGIILLLVAGVVNTALAYALYFSGIEHVSAQSASILSYIDPVVAVVLSAVVLGESMTWTTALGIVLVIGGAFAGEVRFGRHRR
ncbi:MAG: EamA family transporter [Spirochaetales bacterium]|nr:EamA family transporter [Spirochaetales bacterium]